MGERAGDSELTGEDAQASRQGQKLRMRNFFGLSGGNGSRFGCDAAEIGITSTSHISRKPCRAVPRSRGLNPCHVASARKEFGPIAFRVRAWRVSRGRRSGRFFW
jgi:hypothetical protein